MFGSLRLGKFFGIDTYVHGTFWLLPLFVLVGGVAGGNVSGAAGEVLFLFSLFGCVALHEVGHALAARYYGVRTRDITLYPMGGVASLERMPEKPGQEVVIALAGPAVNLAIAAGIFVGLLGGGVALPGSFDPSALDAVDGFVVRLMQANLFLLLFNLIPAFPMDGGRVLRAVLATGMSRLDATKAAVGVGSVLAVVGGVYGLMAGHFMLTFVAVVVFLLGHAELAAVRAEDSRWRWGRSGEDGGAIRVIDVRPHETFSGWVWDARRRAWVEWRDGVAVREILN
ncbi:site-2 protease family protein [Urbifossiella limnaea]|uniref:Zinc metalloprotease Rip3 n=1 Tax=Urbifossiella limnaea TaxID=2528023 RepID=A0A517XTJ1_9BACT|nr:site-2 protease family protein [Urbifossiella limnaea]QDU20813.1 Putative zinc metalloprotease Rip3 [Urbifossiella limnaea]